MSIATRIEAIEQHLTDDYSVLTLAGADLTNVDKNIVNLKPTWQERLLYFMNNGTDVVWNNWNKVTGTGTDVTLNNTLYAPMKIGLSGNTYQYSTSGKNLVNIYGSYVKREAATYQNIIASDETLSYSVNSGVAGYLGFVIPVTVGTNYTLSYSSVTSGIHLIELDSAITEVGTNYGTSRSSGYSFTASKPYVGIWLLANNSSSYSGSVSNLMLRLSSTSDTYEPYTGGIPSPNPDYPQDIHVVSGDNSVKIEGKNLWNKDNPNALHGYYDGYGRFTSAEEYRTISFECVQNDKFVKSGTGWGGIVTFWNNDTFVSYVNSTSCTIPSGVNNVRFACQYSSTNAQLEKGTTTATSYEPYTGASYPINLPEGMELCKIGDYQDKIDKSSGKNLVDMGEYLSYAYSYQKQEENIYTFTTGGNFYTQGLAVNIDKECTISYKIKNGTGTNFRLRFKYEDGTTGEVATGSGTGTSEVDVSYTIPQNNIDTRGKVVELVGNWSNAGSFTMTNLMINYGSTALPYEPYGTSWYLKKEIGKITLTGASGETWNVAGTVTSGVYRLFCNDILNLVAKPASASDLPNVLCNRYEQKTSNQTYLKNEGISIATNGRLEIYDSDYTTNDVSLYKTYISTNNLIVYYPLATPTYEPITDTTLLSQLEAAKTSYEGQTNLSQVNDDLPFILDLTALEKLS